MLRAVGPGLTPSARVTRAGQAARVTRAGLGLAPRAGLAAALLALAGCGFLASGDRPATKPDTFALRGYASVAGVPNTGIGAVCQAPPWAADIHAGGPVRVADSSGRTLAAGQLAAGVLAVADGVARCNFPFEIPGVPGGVDRYVIGVGNRPAVSFPARELRENKPAVITVEP